jgi:hypothetical protein
MRTRYGTLYYTTEYTNYTSLAYRTVIQAREMSWLEDFFPERVTLIGGWRLEVEGLSNCCIRTVMVALERFILAAEC